MKLQRGVFTKVGVSLDTDDYRSMFTCRGVGGRTRCNRSEPVTARSGREHSQNTMEGKRLESGETVLGRGCSTWASIKIWEEGSIRKLGQDRGRTRKKG